MIDFLNQSRSDLLLVYQYIMYIFFYKNDIILYFDGNDDERVQLHSTDLLLDSNLQLAINQIKWLL